MSANDLSACLWRERELLDLLAFKLEEEQFLLTTGKSRSKGQELPQPLPRGRECERGLARGHARKS